MIVVGKGSRGLGKSPFPEVGMSTMGNLPLMRRGALCRPSNWTDCGMRYRNEPRTGRCCLEGQMAGSGLSESPEASSPRFSGPSWFLAQTPSCLIQRLGQELTSQ